MRAVFSAVVFISTALIFLFSLRYRARPVLNKSPTCRIRYAVMPTFIKPWQCAFRLFKILCLPFVFSLLSPLQTSFCKSSLQNSCCISPCAPLSFARRAVCLCVSPTDVLPISVPVVPKTIHSSSCTDFPFTVHKRREAKCLSFCTVFNWETALSSFHPKGQSSFSPIVLHIWAVRAAGV